MVIRNPGEVYCWNDQGHEVHDHDLEPEYGPSMVLRFFKELHRALLCFWRMRDASVLYFDECMLG